MTPCRPKDATDRPPWDYGSISANPWYLVLDLRVAFIPDSGAVLSVRQPENGLDNGTRVDWRGGFVSAIHLTTAAFVGGERCEACQGTGNRPNGYASSDPRCGSCSGAGRTPGLAKSLFELHPITDVRLTDREPLHDTFDGRAYYVAYSTGWRYAAHLLPFEITGESFITADPSREDLLAHVSDRLVAYGRRLAGLPELGLPRPATPV